MMKIMDTYEMASVARMHPIEDIVQNASERIWSGLKGEPTREALADFRSLLFTAEKALECILTQDSKCRPTHEWMAALATVEGIRDEAAEMIDMLATL